MNSPPELPLEPIFLSYPIRTYAFGGTLIRDELGKTLAPAEQTPPLAETWEVSDYGPPEASAVVVSGPLAGMSLRELVARYPQELMGTGFKGEEFPMLAKLLDASHLLPVHLHANDATAQRKYGAAHGKTEAWHIVWAAPGASILAGVQPGVTREELRLALLEQRYDDVMPRHAIQAGDTVNIPGGVLHTFGPDTLVYEIQQTSDLGVSAMPHDLYGKKLSPEEWHANIDALLDELVWEPQPRPHPGLALPGGVRTVCAAGPHFALERLHVSGEFTWTVSTAQILSTLHAPLTLHIAGRKFALAAAQSVILPACIGEVTLQGEGDALLSYVPVTADLKDELRAAGFTETDIHALGELA